MPLNLQNPVKAHDNGNAGFDEPRNHRRFVDDDGVIVFTVPSPIAEDSSGIDGQREPATTSLIATIAQSAQSGVWWYTVKAEPEPVCPDGGRVTFVTWSAML